MLLLNSFFNSTVMVLKRLKRSLNDVTKKILNDGTKKCLQ